jgi:lysophospholipase L1-like esterase
MTAKIKRPPFFLLPVITAIFIFTACSSGGKGPRLADGAVILAFGDSLTFGTGAAPSESYPAVLERLVGRKVINAGIPGEVTEEGLSRLPGVLDKEKPALLILCHGGNDMLRRMNRRQTEDNFRSMIKLAIERNIFVVIISVPSPGLALSPPSFYSETAKEFKMPFDEKIMETVLSDSSLKSDYIHPNAAGYRRIAESIAGLLKNSGVV